MRGDAGTEGSQVQEREPLPGRRDRALAAAVVETCATGTRARKARRIAERMGVGRLSKDQAGAIARSLDADAAEPLGRDLSGYRMPYLWLDATCVRRLRGGRVASAAVAAAMGRDRGGHHRWPGRIGIRNDCGIVRSMSRKGHSLDSSRMEGFFGRLKVEFFCGRDWQGVAMDEFMGMLDGCMVWYRDRRRKSDLGHVSPMQYRKNLGLAA